MYSGYTTSSALALRAKGSFSYHRHLSFPDDARAEGCCGGGRSCCLVESSAPSSLAALYVNPRILYGYYYLRQSALIHWYPSRRLVAGSVRYCRLPAACESGRSLVGGRVRRRREGCCSGRVCFCCSGGGGGGGDGRFSEVLGLLAEVEYECCRESVGVCRCSADEYYGNEEGYDWKGSARIESSRREDSSREDSRRMGANRLSSNYSSDESTLLVPSLDDFGGTAARRGRIRKETSGNYSKDEGFSRTDVRKSEEDARRERRWNASSSKSDFRKTDSGHMDSSSREVVGLGVTGKKDTSLSNSTRHAMQEEHLHKRNHQLREELQKHSRTSEVREESTKRDSSYKNHSDAKVEKNEEISTLAASLIKEVKRQWIEIDQLRNNYQTLLNRSEVQNTNMALTSRLEEREDISTSVMSLVEELRKQRVEIDRLIRSNQELITSTVHVNDTERRSNRELITSSTVHVNDTERRSNQEHITSSTVHVNDLERRSNQECITSSTVYVNDTERITSSNNVYVSRLTDRKESSTSAVYLVDLQREQEQQSHVNQSQKDYQKNVRSSEVHASDNQQVSGLEKVSVSRLRDRAESSTSAVDLVEKRREQHSYADQFRKAFEKLRKSSEIHESDTKIASSLNEASISKTKDRQECSTVAIDLAEERTDQQVYSGQFRKDDNQKLTGSLEIHEIGNEGASSLSNVSLSRRGGKEKSSSSAVNLVAEIKEKQGSVEQSRKEQKKLIKSPEIHKFDGMRESKSNDTSISRLSSKDGSSTAALNLTEAEQEQQGYVDQQTVGRGKSGKSSQEHFGISEIEQSFTGSGTVEIQEEGSSLILAKEATEKDEVNFLGRTKSSRTASTMSSSGTLDSVSSSVDTGKQQIDEQSTINDLYKVKDDVLESASRLDKSSSQYVVEFVDKLRQEMLVLDELDAASEQSSGIQMESPEVSADRTTGSPEQSTPEATKKYETETHTEEGSGQSSAFSDARGPSDEMWVMTGPSTQEPSQKEEPEMWDIIGPSSQEPSRKEEAEKESSEVAVESTTVPTNSGYAITRRSNRSLWGFIADVIRMGWISRAGSQHKSPQQSGTQSSSNESVNSETWFSVRDQNEDENNHAKKVRRGSVKETVSIKRPIDQQASGSQVSGQQPSGSQVLHQAAEATRSESRAAQMQAEGSLFVGTGTTIGEGNVPIESSPLLGSVLVSGKEGSAIPSAIAEAVLPSATVDISPSPKIDLEITGVRKGEVHENETTKSGEKSLGGKLAETVESEAKDGDLRRRKFQRNKQVLREQFDEWEEAYKLEREQRETDELFMKEALIEAKKAADMWEVPIGAVLVQNGKIIARGSNLVEELRDSTAHAEMICIREASNLLRSWRLSETTLYVTLEPCAMCAGAILQARIDIVVWGAPNKLLGADGSWVRLFPGGDEGKDVLGESSQTAGPVHPFHPKIKIRRGILATECSEVMQQFFQLRRKNDKKQEQPQQHSRLSVSAYPNKLLNKMHNMFCMMFCL